MPKFGFLSCEQINKKKIIGRKIQEKRDRKKKEKEIEREIMKLKESGVDERQKDGNVRKYRQRHIQ